MLQNIREKFSGWVALLILGLIAVTFVFVGGYNFSGIGNVYAAKVNGSEISVNEFENAYRDQLQRNPQFAQLPDEFRLQLRRGVLDSLVRDRLVELYLADAGFRVSDEQLLQSLQEVPDFQNEGKFDREIYESLLLQNGLNVEQFEANQRRALRNSQLQRAIGATAIVTPADYRRYLNLMFEQRLATLATFDIASIREEVEVSDAMVEDYYAENESLYQIPESADIEYIEVRKDLLAEGIEVDEETLQAYYETNKDRYLQDEQRQARHILILSGDDAEAAEAEATALLARAQAGEPFEDLARTYSKDGGTSANGGDLGVLTQSQLPGELGNAIFAMAEGDIEGLVKTDFGFHVVKLDRILEQGPLPLDQVRGELLTELRERDAESAFRDLERQVSDALFDSDDLATIAQTTGLEVQSASGITRFDAGPFGSNQAAIDAVYSPSVLVDRVVSDVIEIDANRSAIFKVTNYIEPTRQPLSEVRDQVVAAVRDREAANIVDNRAEQLLAALNNGEDMAAAAEMVGAGVSSPTLLSRQQQDVDQAVLSQVFAANKPVQGAAPVAGKVSNFDGNATVFRLEAVLPGRPESIPLADRDAGRQQLAQQSGASEYYLFVGALYESADIAMSQDVLAAQDFMQ